MTLRSLTLAETTHIGRLLGDPLVAFGHPLTCNGGNRDFDTHHDHEVIMLLDTETSELVCPECARRQSLFED